MFVPELGFKLDYFFTCNTETKMSGLDDTCMYRPHRNFVDSLALNLLEFIFSMPFLWSFLPIKILPKGELVVRPVAMENYRSGVRMPTGFSRRMFLFAVRIRKLHEWLW